MSKTHWKKILTSNYLGGVDLDDGNGGYKRIVLTIKDAKRETIIGEGGRKDDVIVVNFAENVKPLILNRTNSKTVIGLSGSNYVEDWAGLRIELYFDPTVRFGKDVTGGIRVMKVPPKQAVSCSDCGETIKAAGGATVEQIITGTEKTYGVKLCMNCAGKRKANG